MAKTVVSAVKPGQPALWRCWSGFLVCGAAVAMHVTLACFRPTVRCQCNCACIYIDNGSLSWGGAIGAAPTRHDEKCIGSLCVKSCPRVECSGIISELFLARGQAAAPCRYLFSSSRPLCVGLHSITFPPFAIDIFRPAVLKYQCRTAI